MTVKEMKYFKPYKGFRETLDEGVYKGINYQIRSLGAYPCAYIGLPPDHPFSGKTANEIHLDCHGGLTYSFIDYKGRVHDIGLPKEYYWIGWDYAHLGDYSSYTSNSLCEDYYNKQWTTKEIKEEVENVIDELVEKGDT